jgi:hypothetical protein
MKKGLAILTSVAFGLVLFTGGAMAYDYGANFGENITISDEDNRGNGWYSDREDQEVEPDDVATQTWDLEAMFLGDNTLTMVMGYDFMNGVGVNSSYGVEDNKFKSGDIYFDTTGSVHTGTADAEFGTGDHTPGIELGSGSGNKTVQYNWGYDLVFDIDWNTPFTLISDVDGIQEYSFNYDIVKLLYDDEGNALSSNTSGYFRENDESGAWKYDGGGDVLGSGTGSYLVGLDNGLAGEGITGGSHNAVSVDLGSIDTTVFVSHFTMQCGNDNLMGDPVPEPSTIILLGLGILGLVGFRKKFVK